jgi:hypothetical protein
MTQKSDGKSETTPKTENIETQRPQEEEDSADVNVEDLKKKQSQYKQFFLLGVFAVVLTCIYLFGKNEEETVVEKQRQFYLEREAARKSQSV